MFESGSTVLILDEIQDCPEVRTALKFFRIDRRYDVIGTGSLLGVKGYGKEPKSIPVGSETVIDMYPLDFEEFLWANGIAVPVIDMIRNCLQKETPVPEALHNRMKQLLLQYVVVVGMPDAVQTFVDTKQMYSRCICVTAAFLSVCWRTAHSTTSCKETSMAIKGQLGHVKTPRTLYFQALA